VNQSAPLRAEHRGRVNELLHGWDPDTEPGSTAAAFRELAGIDLEPAGPTCAGPGTRGKNQ